MSLKDRVQEEKDNLSNKKGVPTFDGWHADNPKDDHIEFEEEEYIEMPTEVDFPISLTKLAVFEDAIAACEGKTECSPQFIFAGVMTATAAILGRTVGIESFPSPLYPNVYITLCGRSGGSRKSSALKFSNLLISRVGHPVMNIHGLATPEGLVRQFALPQFRKHGGEWEFPNDHSKIEDEEDLIKAQDEFKNSVLKLPPMGVDRYVDKAFMEEMLDQSSEFEGFRAVATLDEFSSVLKKAKSKSADGLIQKISQFYSDDKIDNPSSGSPTRALNPCLNILGATSIAWLNKTLSFEDIEGGFGRRLQFITDCKVPAIAFPSPPDETFVGRVVTALQNCRTSNSVQRIYTFSDSAKKQVTNAYSNLRERVEAEQSDNMKAVIEGYDQHMRKAALIFAALDEESNNPVIESKHIGFAMEWAEFVLKCQQSVFGQFAYTESDVNEKRIKKWLTGRDWKSMRDIARGSHLSADETRKAIEALVAIGAIEVSIQHSLSGREVPIARICE